MTVKDIANVVVDYLATLSNGTVLTTCDAVSRTLGCEFISGGKYRIGDEVVETMEFFDIDETIKKIAEDKGLILDSSRCAGVPTGLPFNIPYTVSKADDMARETGSNNEWDRSDDRNVTLNDAWKEDFAPQILARGKKYFEEGRVCCIRKRENTYKASVTGTEDYAVEIDIVDGVVDYMECDCPYAVEWDENCKHMAAVLFALESENVCVEELPPAKQPTIVPHIPMELPWLEAIENLPADVVRKELLKRADRDDRLKERLAVLYLGKLPEHQLQNWKASLQETAGEYTDRRGSISDEDTSELLNDLGNFMDAKLPLLLEVGAVMDAFHLIWIVMETALEWELDDYYEELPSLFDDCEDALRKVWALATDTQQEQMMQWYQEHRNEEWSGDVKNMDRVFRSLTQPDTPVTEKRVIKYLDFVPYFLCEGEWLPFPKRIDLYYDFVEDTSAYKEAMPIIKEIIKENMGEMYGCFGSCHTIWHLQKQLLLEKYGIEWFTPAELNQDVDFD